MSQNEEIIELKQEIEKLKKEKELARAHRLALGTLTLGVAHEILNPLAVIYSELELIKIEPRGREFLLEYHKKNVKHLERIKNIVERMCELARIEKRTAEIVLDLNEIVEISLGHLVVEKNIKIVRNFCRSARIKGILEDLEKAVYNLLDNAVHALKHGGSINITTEKKADKIELKIEDNGIGILEENLERIFDPFWSSRHEAAGLGLSNAYRIIKEHEGDIGIASKVGVGTTVTIVLKSMAGGGFEPPTKRV